MNHRPSNFPLQSVIGAVRFYRRLVSPFLGRHCRYFPSCSEYAECCFEHYGLLHGFWLSVGRLLRCHPFCAGGYDPPPIKGARKGAIKDAPEDAPEDGIEDE